MYLRLAALSLAAAMPLLLTAGEAPEPAAAPVATAPPPGDFALPGTTAADIPAAAPRDPALALATAAAAAARANTGRNAFGLAGGEAPLPAGGEDGAFDVASAAPAGMPQARGWALR